jgi:hypothetical protein
MCVPLLDRDSVPGELVIRRESRGVSRLGDLAVLGSFLGREQSTLVPLAPHAICLLWKLVFTFRV